MKNFNRYGVHQSLAAGILLSILFGGCILIVEEDDRHHRRHYGGTDWYLEVVIFGVQTMAPQDGEVQVSFVSENAFNGISHCGPFSGDYTLNENGELRIDSFSSDGTCEEEDASSVFVSKFPEAGALVPDDDRLKAEFESDSYMLLVEK